MLILPFSFLYSLIMIRTQHDICSCEKFFSTQYSIANYRCNVFYPEKYSTWKWKYGKSRSLIWLFYKVKLFSTLSEYNTPLFLIPCLCNGSGTPNLFVFVPSLIFALTITIYSVNLENTIAPLSVHRFS